MYRDNRSPNTLIYVIINKTDKRENNITIASDYSAYLLNIIVAYVIHNWKSKMWVWNRKHICMDIDEIIYYFETQYCTETWNKTMIHFSFEYPWKGEVE